ncbi:hypothetical protein E2C01_018091 [Portunus trituberculatus]|uniref:Uncharacterized protein n=1 Tax=Portunus trituberculatus TaxID=210409 RepID=A0A5B7DUK4_PORTR|nr:hypothetical protein [Portunus trituberculatus]
MEPTDQDTWGSSSLCVATQHLTGQSLSWVTDSGACSKLSTSNLNPQPPPVIAKIDPHTALGTLAGWTKHLVPSRERISTTCLRVGDWCGGPVDVAVRGGVEAATHAKEQVTQSGVVLVDLLFLPGDDVHVRLATVVVFMWSPGGIEPVTAESGSSWTAFSARGITSSVSSSIFPFPAL